jgi:hypothetical protein
MWCLGVKRGKGWGCSWYSIHSLARGRKSLVEIYLYLPLTSLPPPTAHIQLFPFKVVRIISLPWMIVGRIKNTGNGRKIRLYLYIYIYIYMYMYIHRSVCHGCCGVGSGTTYIRHTTDECNSRSDTVTTSFVLGMVGGRVGLLGSHPFLRTQIRTLILQHSSSDRPSIPTLPSLTLPTT